ncbi:hypothetical protein [Marinospirillum insulare]|uniref:Oxidoreductase n=1 Tax=Marinospirillum insulare TaxID=217169 RepID=A0ABQ5ZZM6_9GAMM|nr:hypothetical protein [Marinospirillum insulare]GLR63335.1 oxidoreductase [Marinospirillum insulare]
MLRSVFLPLITCLLISPAFADLPKAEGEVLLTVTGKITHTNQQDTAVFDLSLLESLEQQEIITHNPWFSGSNRYYGPLGRSLVKAVGADFNSNMRVTSLNGFITEIPVSDFVKYDVILALKKNGKYQRIRDRGPIFTIYPFDQHPKLNTEKHYNRSVWQVEKIEFY